MLYGNTGWGCCIRGEIGMPDRGEGEVLREAADIRSHADTSTAWLLFTDRSGEWEEIQRNDPEIVVGRLRELGCVERGRIAFPLVALRRLECGH